MSKQPPPAPTASTVGPCPTVIQIVGRPGTGSLPSTIAPPDHPLIWMIVRQGPIALAVGAGGGCLDIFTLIYPFSPLSPSLWETARYRLKYCLKGPLNPKQPTNQPPVEWWNIFDSGTLNIASYIVFIPFDLTLWNLTWSNLHKLIRANLYLNFFYGKLNNVLFPFIVCSR